MGCCGTGGGFFEEEELYCMALLRGLVFTEATVLGLPSAPMLLPFLSNFTLPFLLLTLEGQDYSRQPGGNILLEGRAGPCCSTLGGRTSLEPHF